MAENKRRVAFTPNKGGSFRGSGKIANAAVKVVSYDVSSKNVDEHFIVVSPLSNIYDNDGKLVAEKGKDIQVFTPPEMEVVDGKKRPKTVRTRRNVMGLKGKTSMAYSTGDAMPPGSIVGLSKLWVAEAGPDGDKKPAIFANYTEGLLHPDAQIMETKNPPAEDGHEQQEDGKILTGFVLGTNCAISVRPATTKKNEDGSSRQVQLASVIVKDEAEAIESTPEAIAEKIDAELAKADGDMGTRGVLLMGYKRMPEGLSEEEQKEFASNYDNRVAVPVIAYSIPVEGTDEWVQDGKSAVESKLLSSENPYYKEVVNALNSGEWDFSTVPLYDLPLAPSLIPGNENNKTGFDLSRNSAVIDADPLTDEDGKVVRNEKGYVVYGEASVAEYGYADLDYAVINRATDYFHENGVKLSSAEKKISWADRKALVAEGGYCSATVYSSLTKVAIAGGFSPKPAFFMADVITNQTPEAYVDAINEDRKNGDLLGKTIAYNTQNKKAPAEQEAKKESTPTP